MKLSRWLALTVLAGALFSVAAPAGAAAPANDRPSAARSFSSLPFTATQTTEGATYDALSSVPPDCASTSTVWFKYTAASSGPVVVHTRGSNFDSTLAMFEGDPSASVYAFRSCSDDGPRLRSVVAFDAIAGRDYFIQAGGFDGATGDLKLTVNRGGVLRGVVRSSSGQPVVGACLAISTASKYFNAFSATDGSYAIGGLPAGEYPTPSVQCTDGRMPRPWPAPAYVGEGVVATAPDLIMDLSAIEGVLRDDATGTPISGACVSAIGPNSTYSGLTSATGYYSVVTAPGTYAVQYCGGRDYATEFYGDAFLQADATPVAVTRGVTTSGVDASLVRSATVVGTIREAGTNSTVFASCVRILSARDGQPLALQYASKQTGFYRVTGLPPVDVVVKGSECNTVPGTHVDAWYDGAGDRQNATVVGLGSGQTVTANVRLPVGASIYGYVRNDEGDYEQSGACVAAEWGDGSTSTAMTDSRGNFRLGGLPTGNYTVRFCGGNGTAPEWFDDANDRASARVIGVTPQTAFTVIAHVGRGGFARGRFVDDATGKPASPPPCMAATHDNGVFQASTRFFGAELVFDGLATGRYTISGGCAGASPRTVFGVFDAVLATESSYGVIRMPSVDKDNDGKADRVDNCPLTPNPDQADVNDDDLGNVCDRRAPGGTSSNAPKLTVADRAVAEGNAARTIQLHVRLSRAAGHDVSVRVKTANETALAGSDYVAVDSVVTFGPSTTDVVIPLRIKGDRVKEPNETFTVNLSSPTGGAVIGRGKATITLTNDD